jgi:transposase
VLRNRTSVGLDVHARSVVACGLDGQTGQLFERRLTPDRTEIFEWIRGLPGPVAVTYEAGPTGFGLARFLTGRGISCQVAAPSKLQRPPGDRVKTDVRDARHLARLLHLGEIVAVTVPSVEQEAARDLVRAREDVRRDLTSARHRLSKLLLRQGIVYYGRRVVDWSARPVAARPAPGVGVRHGGVRDRVRHRLRHGAGHHGAAGPAGRGDHPNGRRQLLHHGGGPAGLPARGGHVDRVRAGGGDRGLAPVDRPLDRRLPRAGTHRILLRRFPPPGIDHQDRQRTRPPAADRAAWHHRPPNRIGAELRRRQDAADPAARHRAQQANRRLHQRWVCFDARGKRTVIANTAVARELAGWCWSLAVLD